MLTPIDIENKEFGKVFRGYDMVEVDEFKRTLVTDYEKLYRENAELKEKNAMLNEAIGSYKGMEETMQNAIMVAQRTAEDIKKNAYERSETIVKDAQRRAGEAINNANRAIANLEKTYISMQTEMNSFRAKMSALLSTYMQLLSELPEQNVPRGNAAFSQVLETSSQENMLEMAQGTKSVPLDADYENTGIFTIPTKEEKPFESAPGATGLQTERTINPVVEELLKKKQETASAAPAVPVAPAATPAADEPLAPVSQAPSVEEEFSVTMETIDKEPEEGTTTINVDQLTDFDVFSDDTI